MERRTFIKAGSLATSAIIAPIQLKKSIEKIKLGIVGVGWWGTDFILRFALESNNFEIVGLCDVDQVTLKNASDQVLAAGGSAPKLFANYEDLYEMPGLQAVAIVTPTHWHPLQFIAACEKGLDVWLEKPLSYDIRELQAMQKAHTKAGNIVNVDFPRMYSDANAEVKEIIDSGELGAIRQIQFNIHSGGSLPPIAEIPPTFDYETFCGPAPKLPYRCQAGAVRPRWRAQQGFSRGVLADWGIHYLQNIRTVMGLDLPDAISAIGGNILQDGRQHPDHLEVKFDFDGLPVQWSYKAFGFTNPLPHTNIGTWYYGDKATMWVYDLGMEIYSKNNATKTIGFPKEPYGSPKFVEITNKAFLLQFNLFADAIRSQSDHEIRGSFDEGFKATASIIFADMAYRTKSPLVFDHQSLDVLNNEEASSMLKRAYRKPYVHPYVG